MCANDSDTFVGNREYHLEEEVVLNTTAPGIIFKNGRWLAFENCFRRGPSLVVHSPLMLCIYILILKYDFVSFLVFWSHFYVCLLYFSCRIQRPWKCVKRCQKVSKMDAHNESRQRVFATAKYILAAANAKFVAARVFRIKGLAEQPEPIHCNKNLSRCSENTLSWPARARNPRV